MRFSEMDQSTRILIVDDDPIMAENLADLLSKEGYVTITAGDGAEALMILEHAYGDQKRKPIGIVITDMNMPRVDGMELLRRIREKYDWVVPIVVTGFGKIESAVETIKLGAADYLTKPVVDDELRLAVSKAVNQHVLLSENRTLKNQLTERYGLANLVGSDYQMQQVYELIEAVAETRTTVLISGESGTGKTMVARAVHAMSSRRSGPFVTISCGAIPETILESELFGHKRGAFTGADIDKPGKCLAADGGTLFIDEINSATPALQLKLLRVLQEKAFEPVGSTQTQHVDARFVLATNANLEELVIAAQFREDLYYRINVVNIHIPPLRERVGDIPLLADHFLAKYCNEMDKQRQFSSEAMDALQGYAWPGNVRELENVVERSVVLSKQLRIQWSDLPEKVRGQAINGAAENHRDSANESGSWKSAWTPGPLAKALQEPERDFILTALKANEWNRQATAKVLDINRTTLYKKIKQYGLDEPGWI